MKSCRSALCLLLLLITRPVFGLTPAVVNVTIHYPAVLPCTDICNSSITWSLKINPLHRLAECNQSSCQVKNGFNISHHQYQQGNFSLTIDSCDLNKMTTYMCQCNKKIICEVRVQVKEVGPLVKVKTNDRAVLSFQSTECNSSVRWCRREQTYCEILVECNQTLCRSLKEGYQMIHEQYLQDDYSLTICNADFSKRGAYTCQCNESAIYDVRLQIEPLNSSVPVKPNSSLVMELDVPDPVEVMYSSSDEADGSSYRICKVAGESLQISPGYEQRMSFALELKNMSQSNSGVYIIRDANTKEDIHIYTVNVTDDPQPDLHTDPNIGAAVPGWAWASVGGNVLLVLVLIGLVVMMSVRRSNTTECFLMNKLPARGEEEESPTPDP